MNSPRTVYVNITSRCNLKCKYCSHFFSPSDTKKDLPLSNWLEFFSKLGRENVMNIVISGGEPFLREDIKEMLKEIIKNRMRFSILTNGTIFSKELFEFISNCKRCDYIQVSVDGHRPEVHDSMRGEGSFEKTINTIKVLKKYNIPIAIRVTIHPENVYYIKEIAKFLLEDLKLKSFSTNSINYIGLGKKNYKELQLNIEEYSFVLKAFLELNKIYKNKITAKSGPLALLAFWSLIKNVKKDKLNIKGGYLLGCNAVFSSLAVRSDGVIVPCNLLSHIELGNIEDDLQKIWKENSKLNELRNRRNIKLTCFEYCRDCIYINYCTGGCPALSYANFYNINKPDTRNCLRYLLEQGLNLDAN